MSMKPKISVVVPSFNQAVYLEETLLSIINQSYSNFELIVIDGGSSDDSIEIIKKYSDNIAFWVSEKDNGQTHAINKGFKIAKGDLVCWMNSDDVFCEDAFLNIAELYCKYPDVDVFYGDKVHIDYKGNELFIQRYAPYRVYTFANDKMAMCNQACFWKRSVFERIGFLDESIQFAMDLEYFVRMGMKGLSFLHRPILLGKQRYYSGTKTSEEKWQKVLHQNRTEIIQRYGLKQNLILKLRSKYVRLIYYFFTGNIGYVFEKKKAVVYNTPHSLDRKDDLRS